MIGAIVRFDAQDDIICAAALQNTPNAATQTTQATPERCTKTIPFIPISETAFQQSVTAYTGDSAVPQEFQQPFEEWQRDPKGLSVFTVRFEGKLDRMIAMQMAAIVDTK